MNIEVGLEFSDPSAYADTAKFFLNTRGFLLRGSIGEKLSFETFFSENQFFVPLYQRKYIVKYGVVPGSARFKHFQSVGFDLGYVGGSISYQALKNWNIQFGHGKHFIGEGYRSVILSDNSAPYPYFRSSLNFLKGKLEFTSLCGALQNLNRLPIGDSPESLFERKGFSMNSVSYAPIKQFRIGISEGVIWQNFSHPTGDKKFNVQWINPIPLINSTSLSWDEPDNLFVGFDIAIKPLEKLILYGQYMIDDAHTNRTSFQYGLKAIDVFLENLWLRFEYNESERYTGSQDLSLQSITHNNQPLAHPLGAGFREYIFQVSYKYGRWFTDCSYQNVAEYYKDIELSSGEIQNNGIDILIPYPDEIPPMSTFIPSDLKSVKIRVGYFFNPFNNFMAFLSFQNRTHSGATFLEEKNGLLSIGIKTDLFNHYYDF